MDGRAQAEIMTSWPCDIDVEDMITQSQLHRLIKISGGSEDQSADLNIFKNQCHFYSILRQQQHLTAPFLRIKSSRFIGSINCKNVFDLPRV
jgi:hypothetical protein